MLSPIVILLANVSGVDSISIPGGGVAGWAASLMSGGVLVWLLFWHLPAKDKQLEKFQDGKDTMLKELTEKHEKKLEKISEDFKVALQSVLTHCDKETQELVSAFRSEMASLRASRNSKD